MTTAHPQRGTIEQQQQQQQQCTMSSVSSVTKTTRWAMIAAGQHDHHYQLLGLFVVGIIVVVAFSYWLVYSLYRYRRSIRKRLKKLQEESLLFGGLRMKRVVVAVRPTTASSSSSNRPSNSSTSGQCRPPPDVKHEEQHHHYKTNTNTWALFELDDDFKVKYSAKGWSFLSLGEYLSSLRPAAVPASITESNMIPDWVKSEVEAALSASLLRVLGPNLGRAFLPALAFGPVGGLVQKVTTLIASKFAGGIVIEPTTKSKRATRTTSTNATVTTSEAHSSNTDHMVEDKAFLPVSLLGILALTEHGATRAIENGTTTTTTTAAATTSSSTTSTTTQRQHPNERPRKKKLSSIDKMKLGEFGADPPLVRPDQDSIDDATTTITTNCIIPNPFIMNKHWQAAIVQYEATLQRIIIEHPKNGPDEEIDTNETPTSTQTIGIPYDPFARDLAAPVPVNERLFPDLYMGWGDAQCTHTHREILQNRLLCILLNRLAANYYRIYNATPGPNQQQQQHQQHYQLSDIAFVVRMSEDSRDISRPHDFIDGLIRSGNKIELVVTTHPTSFGAALCVKDQNKWSNLPLATFVNSGYETADGEEAHALLPHSGLNLELRGPLIGNNERISVQHFIGIEGYCGWMSNHNANVPWLQDIECGPVVSRNDVVIKTVRTAALYGLLLNIVGTELELPFGGYGLVGVCNDSAAIMEYILHGKTHIYPLTAVGKYSVHVMRKAKQFQAMLKSTSGYSEEVKSIDDIIWAMKTLPSDIHACPSSMVGAATRMLHCLPAELPFKLMKSSKRVGETLVAEAKFLFQTSTRR